MRVAATRPVVISVSGDSLGEALGGTRRWYHPLSLWVLNSALRPSPLGALVIPPTEASVWIASPLTFNAAPCARRAGDSLTAFCLRPSPRRAHPSKAAFVSRVGELGPRGLPSRL